MDVVLYNGLLYYQASFSFIRNRLGISDDASGQL
jgi:hypothetical protein